MKNILVFGDSIPWGLIPATKFERYGYDKRWPGILQGKLGTEYHIIEENLAARTIDSDDLRPGFEGRNGMSILPALLDSHYPLDMVILSLGLNEIKSIYDWTPAQVAEKLGKMIGLIRNRKPNFHDVSTKIVLVSQPIVESTGFWGELWVGSHDKSIALETEFEKLAGREGIGYIKIKGVTPNANDGVHLDDTEHVKIAEQVYKYIRSHENA